MGRKGGKKHLKRKPAPKTWPIKRKEYVWTIKPRAGPHPLFRCLPLTIALTEILGYAKTRREAKKIISEGKMEVDGKSRRDERYSIGLMDVVSVQDVEETYRVLPSEKGLILHRIGKDEAGFKICRIEDKTILKNDDLQLHLHDGRNISVRAADLENNFKTLYSLKISVPDQEVLKHITLAEGSSTIIIGGKNMGKYGKIVEIEQRQGQRRRRSLVTVQDKKGSVFQTVLDYVFPIGETEPEISLPGVD